MYWVNLCEKCKVCNELHLFGTWIFYFLLGESWLTIFSKGLLHFIYVIISVCIELFSTFLFHFFNIHGISSPLIFKNIYFTDYAITVVPIFPPLPHPPGTPHSLWQSPHTLSSCSWVMHVSSLFTPFPILFLISLLSILYLPICSP